jgi:hypothetical protein
MAETYRLELHASGPYAGCESNEVVKLSEWGYSDEEWDELTEGEKGKVLEEWGSDYFWNQGYEYNAEVKRG